MSLSIKTYMYMCITKTIRWQLTYLTFPNLFKNLFKTLLKYLGGGVNSLITAVKDRDMVEKVIIF